MRTSSCSQSWRLLSLALLVGLSACFSVYTVERSDPDNPTGIPFFAKRLINEHTTSYALTWLEVTVTVKPVEQPNKQGEQSKNTAEHKGTWLVREDLWNPSIVSNAADEATSLDDLRDRLDKELPGLFLDPGSIIQALDFARPDVGEEEKEPTHEGLVLSLIANATKVVAENDYEHPYSVNIRIPWFGTGSGTIKLGNDGSLAEATASVDTKFADSIPLKGLLEKAFAISTLVEPEPSKRSVNFVIDSAQRGYLYSFRARSPAADKCVDYSPLRFLPWTYQFERTVLGSPKDGSDSDNAVSFSGAVKLPKGKE